MILVSRVMSLFFLRDVVHILMVVCYSVNSNENHFMCLCLLSVISFFLEKNMFAFFLNILRQKSGRYVCVQLLQTLNILFENISHETSLCK